MKVICIDSSKKPNNVPINEWIVQGNTYTVIKITKMGLQKNKYGFLLKEVQLSIKSFPYELYDSERFLSIDILISLEKEIEEKEINIEDLDLESI
jgi:hypothetical protein